MNRSLASWLRPFGLLAALSMAVVAGVAPATLANDTPGNNGTVKIHEGAGENDPGEVRNEPHVCTFHLHFYFADPEQAGTWEIQQWAPTGEKGTVVLSGTYDTHGDGEDRQPEQGVYTLPDGHYKLFWDGDLDTGKHDKMKVFWVECAAASESPSPTGSEIPASGSPSTAPSESASTAPSESASTAPSESASTAPSESASTAPSGSEIAASGSPSTAPSESASTAPTGSELPIVGSPPASPTGGVEAVTGTPPPGATPPPTDTDAAIKAQNNNWRIVLLGLAALITAAVMIVPGPAPIRVRTDRKRH